MLLVPASRMCLLYLEYVVIPSIDLEKLLLNILYMKIQYLVSRYYCNLFLQQVKINLHALTDNTAHKNNIIRKLISIVTIG